MTKILIYRSPGYKSSRLTPDHILFVRKKSGEQGQITKISFRFCSYHRFWMKTTAEPPDNLYVTGMFM
jgi:hypothetical protein